MIFFYAAGFGALVGSTILFLAVYCRQRRSPIRRRLRVEQKARTELLKPQLEEGPSFLSRNLVKKIEERLDLRKGSPRFQELRKTFLKAGIYNERAIPVFLGIKIGCLLVLPLLGLFLLGSPSAHMLALAAVVSPLCILGYVLPGFILGRMVHSRQKKIRESLPDALDLLVVCVQAGQGLNSALKRVADDLLPSSPIIARELLMVNLEINAGMDRAEALRNLGERTGVDEVVTLCNILIQSDRFGTSIGQALKTQSETLRTTRRQKLEELAAKTPVKLVFPLILFIFPAIMVVILGPVIIKVSETFLK